MMLSDFINPLEGGATIGLAAATLLLLNGDILGASGITSSVVLSPQKSLHDVSQHWKIIFLAAFLVTSAMCSKPAANASNERILSTLGYALAGLFVGFGTKLGNGCTSGHGICGMARLSKRSIVAVCTFMAVAMMTTYLTAADSMFSTYTNVFHGNQIARDDESLGRLVATAFVGFAIVAAVFFGSKVNMKNTDTAKFAPAVLAAFLFATGLNKGTMVLPSKVFGFLNVAGISDGTFDPSLMFVMMGGVVVSFFSYQMISDWKLIRTPVSLNCPLAVQSIGGKFSVPTNKTIDSELLVGAAFFGMGWGLGGLCPGPALFAAGQGTLPVVYYWWPSFIAGSYVASKLKQ